MSTTKNNETNFSGRLRELRGSRTQAQMADLLGFTSQQTYQNYEKGRIPKPEVLQQIAQQFGVTCEWLLSGNNPRNAESSAKPKEPAGGLEKDLRMERILRLARELNASLAPAIEAEITRTLNDLIHPLETVAKNDGEFSRRMLEAAKSRLDDFAAWSAAQRKPCGNRRGNEFMNEEENQTKP